MHELRATGRPHLPANIALALVSAAIAAALFLVVLLLIEGWRLTPIEAALVVTVMPLAAFWRARGSADSVPSAAGPGALRGVAPRRRASPASACMPKAVIVLTIPPQILVGVGLSLWSSRR